MALRPCFGNVKLCSGATKSLDRLLFAAHRMAQKYYEYVNYKTEHVQEQKRAPHGAYNSYIIAFQTVFYGFFNVRILLTECGGLGWS